MCCQTWAMVMPSCINPMANIMLPLWELGKSLPWAFQRSWNHETPPLAIPSRPGHRSAEFPPAPSFWRLGKNKTFFEGFLGTQSASLNQLKGNSSLYKKTETCWVYSLKVCGPCAFARLAEAKVMRRVVCKTLKIKTPWLSASLVSPAKHAS